MTNELVEPVIDLTALRAARKGPYRPYLEVRFKPLDVAIDIDRLVDGIERLVDAVTELKFVLASVDDIDHRVVFARADLALHRLGLNPVGKPLGAPMEATA